MLRRMMPLLTVLGLGFALLVSGLGALQSVLIAERDESHARVWAERNALQEYARRTLEQRLEELVSEAEINWAREDPLMPTQRLLLVERGRQLFPRPIRYAGGDAQEARQVYTAVLEGRILPAEPGTPWARRLELARACRDAILRRSAGEVETTVRALLNHQSYFRLHSRDDVATELAVLELLVESTNPSPDFMKAILLSGVHAGEALLLEGLQPTLIRRRDRFTAADFQFLSARVIALSERTQVQFDDFRARIAEPVTVPLATPPDMLESPALVLSGTWYARPAGPERIIGTSIRIDNLLQSIESEMRARALLEPSDSLLRPELRDAVVPLRTLVIGVRSPRFARAIADGDRRFWVKTGFVGLSAGLALIIVALALVIQGRRQRFVEQKSDFVATVSHELRTPLASIRLMAETLERRIAQFPSARDYPTRIVREIDDLAFLVDNILSFNRLDKGRWKPRLGQVSLDTMLDEIQQELGSFTPRTVRWMSEGIRVDLAGDPELLRLLIRNLAKNAYTYNERDPIEITFKGSFEGRHFVLAVTDNGIGIEPGDLRKVFYDFFRAHGNVSRGSGLGLAICRRVMHAHGGEITVANSSPQGTTFVLRFPATLVHRSAGASA